MHSRKQLNIYSNHQQVELLQLVLRAPLHLWLVVDTVRNSVPPNQFERDSAMKYSVDNSKLALICSILRYYQHPFQSQTFAFIGFETLTD
jgi:hypothetical protein